MPSHQPQRLSRLLLGLCMALSAVSALAAAPAVVGILQGNAVLVRQTVRYALAEGTHLADGDIVETAADGFAQIELEDGTIASLAEGSRAILKPALAGLKTAAPVQIYLLEGWLKLGVTTKAPAEFELLAPPFELAATNATLVVRVTPKGYEVFVETGSARLLPRNGAAGVALRGNDFAVQAAGADKPSVAGSMSAEFLQQLPRAYRDRLPARAAMYADRAAALKPIGPVEYRDVSPWLHSETPLRLALSRQWRARAADRTFRAEVAANLRAHMEWERVLYPERFLPKKPPLRTAARAPAPAGSAVAARGASGPGAAPPNAPAAIPVYAPAPPPPAAAPASNPEN